MLIRFLKIVGGALALWMAAAPVADASAFLTVIWHEREGDWTGVWSPNNPRAGDGQYRALWRKGSEETSADLVIALSGPPSLSGQDVQIIRTSRHGRCDYTGRLTRTSNPIAYPLRWQVIGTYVCARGPVLQWSAWLDVASPSTSDDRIILPDGADQRLTKRWREQEGDWIGNWVPRDASRPNGEYNARWHKGNNEWESAFLKITINGTVVTVVRTGPKGRCNYTGEFSDNRTAAGQYSCAWDRQRRNWSAIVDD